MSDAPERDAEVLEEVLACVRELNRQLPLDEQLPAAASSPILGEGSGLDSLSIVNLMVAVEDRVRERFGLEVSLLDLAADEGEELATVGTLSAWLSARRP